MTAAVYQEQLHRAFVVHLQSENYLFVCFLNVVNLQYCVTQNMIILLKHCHFFVSLHQPAIPSSTNSYTLDQVI